MKPAAYTRRRDLTPNIRRWMQARGWLDHRRVTRIERPDQAHLQLLNRIKGVSNV